MKGRRSSCGANGAETDVAWLIETHCLKSVPSGGTFYSRVGDPSNFLSDASESQVGATWSTSGTFHDFSLRVQSNCTTAASTATFRKNSANGNRSVSVPANTAGEFCDLTDTDSVSAGDTVDWKLTAGVGDGLTIQGTSEIFTPNWHELELAKEEESIREIEELNLLLKPVAGTGQELKAGPPKTAKLLMLLIPPENREHLIGDLDEEYTTVLVPEYGPRVAALFYWWHAVFSIAPFLLRGIKRLIGLVLLLKIIR